MTCGQLVQYLSDYVDAELDEPLTTAARQHLATCHHCHIVLDSTQDTIVLYREHDKRVNPADRRSELFGQIEATFARRSRTKESNRPQQTLGILTKPGHVFDRIQTPPPETIFKLVNIVVRGDFVSGICGFRVNYRSKAPRTRNLSNAAHSRRERHSAEKTKVGDLPLPEMLHAGDASAERSRKRGQA